MTYAQAQMDAMNRGREEGRAEGRAEGRVEGRTEGRVEGALQMLTALVRDGLLSLKDASKRANMSEKEFAALIAVQ